MLDFEGYISITEQSVIVCQSNHAFSHIPSRFIYGFFFSHSGDINNSKLSLGCKVDQIRVWVIVFEAEISLFMIMFIYVFNVFIKLSLIILNMKMK